MVTLSSLKKNINLRIYIEKRKVSHEYSKTTLWNWWWKKIHGIDYKTFKTKSYQQTQMLKNHTKNSCSLVQEKILFLFLYSHTIIVNTNHLFSTPSLRSIFDAFEIHITRLFRRAGFRYISLWSQKKRAFIPHFNLQL